MKRSEEEFLKDLMAWSNDMKEFFEEELKKDRSLKSDWLDGHKQGRCNTGINLMEMLQKKIKERETR